MIRYQGIDGKEKVAELRNPQPYGTKGELYVFDFDGLLVAELRTVLMATIYEDDVAVTTTLLYSPDTYARGSPELWERSVMHFLHTPMPQELIFRSKVFL